MGFAAIPLRPRANSIEISPIPSYGQRDEGAQAVMKKEEDGERNISGVKVALGRKVDNGFKREAYQAMTEEVMKHTGIPVNRQNVQNRLRYYKHEYITVKDMLAASGFEWDNERMVVTAPDEVWEDYLKSHPRAKHLRGKRIERMHDLAVIVGSDQATRRYVQGSTIMAMSSSRI
ncbi:uncharacterized protein LOC131224220 [Magnolia sinica]|uniref:uncharacterized protein LOC131224220 n=1 Tax=Magnolia sinica TaxID=86752 RepID=UPI002658CC61|nr:uncharacterized protein LOC131224220 [Magnolia sinica]